MQFLSKITDSLRHTVSIPSMVTLTGGLGLLHYMGKSRQVKMARLGELGAESKSRANTSHAM